MRPFITLEHLEDADISDSGGWNTDNQRPHERIAQDLYRMTIKYFIPMKMDGFKLRRKVVGMGQEPIADLIFPSQNNWPYRE